MKEEREIKIEVLDKNESFESIVTQLEKIFSVNFTSSKNELDIYYDTTNNKYFQNNHALRIRNSQGSSFITYKALFYVPQRKSNPWFVLEKEAKFPIKTNFFKELSSLANLNNIKVNTSGFIDEASVKKAFFDAGLNGGIILDKLRTKAYLNSGLEIVIDYIDNLGIFIEFELIDNNSNCNFNLQNLLKKIPFDYKEIRFGYTNLYVERVLDIEVPNFRKMYLNNPNWNYFPNQKKIISNLLMKNKK